MPRCRRRSRRHSRYNGIVAPMNVTLDWQQLAAFTVILTFLGSVGLAVMRAPLSRSFASRSDHLRLAERVERMEQVQRAAPTGADMAALTARVAAVETGVAVTKEAIASVQEGMLRIERMTTLLVQHQLNMEKAP
jgi:hypothetical protein